MPPFNPLPLVPAPRDNDFPPTSPRRTPSLAPLAAPEAESEQVDQEEDDDEEEPLSSECSDVVTVKTKKLAQVGTGVLPEAGLVKGGLKAYRTSTLSVSTLYDLIKDESVDLDPEYQREVVWPVFKQIGLIDSLIKNFYVPAVLFAVSYRPEEHRTCIDGKQRLSSIYAFMSGEIPWKPTSGKGKGKRYFYKYNNQKGGAQLPEKEKREFGMKQIAVVEFDGLTELYERELFQRVQMGMALTSSEKLQAILSPAVTFIKSLVAKYVDHPTGILEYYDKWDASRGKIFSNVGVLAMMVQGYPGEYRYTGMWGLGGWLVDTKNPGDGTKEKMEKVLEVYKAIAKGYSALAFGPKRLSPLEWVFVGVVIHVFIENDDLGGLARKIFEMRGLLKANFSDMRADKARSVFQFLWKWLCPDSALAVIPPPKNPKKRKLITAVVEGVEQQEENENEGNAEAGPSRKKSSTGLSRSQRSQRTAPPTYQEEDSDAPVPSHPRPGVRKYGGRRR